MTRIQIRRDGRGMRDLQRFLNTARSPAVTRAYLNFLRRVVTPVLRKRIRREIVPATPVKTGRMKKGWRISIKSSLYAETLYMTISVTNRQFYTLFHPDLNPAAIRKLVDEIIDETYEQAAEYVTRELQMRG